MANFTQSRSVWTLCQAVGLLNLFPGADCNLSLSAFCNYWLRDVYLFLLTCLKLLKMKKCLSNRDCKCRLLDHFLAVFVQPRREDRYSVAFWHSGLSWLKCTQVWKRNLWLFTRASELQSSLSEALHLCSYSQLVWESGNGSSMILNN